MRINAENRTLDMEPRDFNYIMPEFLKSYLFYNKNTDPDRIVFPMFKSVAHPYKTGVNIPIDWVPMINPAAIEIAFDGQDIPEISPEEEAAIDAKDEEIAALKAELEAYTNAANEAGIEHPQITAINDTKAEGPAHAISVKPDAIPPAVDRQPNLPASGDVGGGGVGPDNMSRRSARDQSMVRRALSEDPDVNESEEQEYEAGTSGKES
tara:strand:- start:509 stop:1135 length:627 start_codon:yes stop_codon:yes gene_type:complete